jgi:hypothetical protein
MYTHSRFLQQKPVDLQPVKISSFFLQPEISLPLEIPTTLVAGKSVLYFSTLNSNKWAQQMMEPYVVGVLNNNYYWSFFKKQIVINKYTNRTLSYF